MTKAKKHTENVWILVDERGDLNDVWRTELGAKANAWPGDIIVPATLTWTPPAKAKKRSAKR